MINYEWCQQFKIKRCANGSGPVPATDQKIHAWVPINCEKRTGLLPPKALLDHAAREAHMSKAERLKGAGGPPMQLIVVPAVSPDLPEAIWASENVLSCRSKGRTSGAYWEDDARASIFIGIAARSEWRPTWQKSASCALALWQSCLL
jgi:hypothetical protein